MKNSSAEETFGEDLSGDPVYDYIKQNVSKGFTILGGKISTPKILTHASPRKMLHFWLKDENTNRITSYSVSYLKTLREMEE